MPAPPPSIDPSIKIVCTFTYRGATKYFSNRFHFDNLSPTDATKWGTLADNITTAQRSVWPSGGSERIVQAVGYDAGSEIPVFTKSYTLAGNGTIATPIGTTGDSCALVRWSTAQRSSKNHPIFLFSYMKPAYSSGTGGDALHASQRTNLTTYATQWVTGFSDGAVTHHRCGPQGHVATGVLVDQWVRHRDFR